MADYQIFVGIDISKNHLDICISKGLEVKKEQRIDNNIKSILDFIDKEKSNYDFKKAIFCMEATGQYSNHLLASLAKHNLAIWLENAVEIKRSLGLQRGKNDKVDAQRIAQYAYRFSDKIKLYKAENKTLKQVRALYQLREQLVETRKRLKTSINEQKLFMDKDIFKSIQKYNEKTIKHLDSQIQKVEEKIEASLKNDQTLQELYEYINSVQGVGKVSTWAILIVTEAFTKFENPKQFACYSGVAPFENSSGKFKGKSKVSNMANKKIKKLLHICAVNAVKHEGDLKDYYQRKIKEGKAKMSILNAVRNKIIHRIFACVKNQRKYVAKGLVL